MSRRSSTAPTTGLLLLASALPACSGSKDSADTAPTHHTGETGDSGTSGPTIVWEEAFDTSSTGALSGVWGTAPDDVWIVGGVTEQGESYHYDGSTWSAVPVPEGVGLLVWVYGFASDDVWAVGVDGAGAHWDGTAWSAVDFGTTEDLWGIFGFSTTDLWIVGGDPDAGDPLILHYDGTTPTVVPLDPAENPRGAKSLFKVWGIDNQLYITGQTGTLLAWDGEAWRFQSGGSEANQDFVSLWGTSADHIVAVGGRGNGRIATWDGSAWTTLAPSGIGGLNAVTMVSPTEAVVGGVNGYVASFDPTTGTLSNEESLTFDDIHAAWYDGAGTTWAVGGFFLEPFTGVAYSRRVED
jgi:hypothetical protein